MDSESRKEEGTQFVPVYEAQNEVTANIVKVALENSGIPALVKPHHTSWLDGALVPAEGSWGYVLVSKENEDKASQIIKEREEKEVELK
jgi:hypothetical protein